MEIYKITNLINGKIYIGCTIRSIERRWKYHIYQKNTTTKMANAIKKYGSSSFKIESLEHCNTREELFNREIFLINKYNSTNDSIGYNMTNGGDCGPIKYGSENKSFGRKNYKLIEFNKTRKGVRLSKQHIERIVLAQIGGKRNSETKLKMAIARKMKWEAGGYKNVGAAISKAKTGVESKKKMSILCLSNNRVYLSIEDATKKLNVFGISNVISGKRNTAKGLSFQKLTEEHLIF